MPRTLTAVVSLHLADDHQPHLANHLHPPRKTLQAVPDPRVLTFGLVVVIKLVEVLPTAVDPAMGAPAAPASIPEPEVAA